MFKYDIHQKESKSIVHLCGDMDIDVTEILQDEIAPRLMDKKEIELDFEQVSFVDSSGIGLLITLVQHIKEQGKSILITHLTPDVKQVFSLLQLPTILGHDVFVDLIKDE